MTISAAPRTTRGRSTTAGRSRAATAALWTVQALLAALFAFAGINKLAGLQPEVVEQFARIGLGDWFRYLTGSLELVGAIGLLIPRLCGLAAIGLAGVMAGAVVTHLTVLPPVALALVPAALGVGFGLIARSHWPRTRALLATFRR